MMTERLVPIILRKLIVRFVAESQELLAAAQRPLPLKFFCPLLRAATAHQVFNRGDVRESIEPLQRGRDLAAGCWGAKDAKSRDSTVGKDVEADVSTCGAITCFESTEVIGL